MARVCPFAEAQQLERQMRAISQVVNQGDGLEFRIYITRVAYPDIVYSGLSAVQRVKLLKRTYFRLQKLQFFYHQKLPNLNHCNWLTLTVMAGWLPVV